MTTSSGPCWRRWRPSRLRKRRNSERNKSRRRKLVWSRTTGSSRRRSRSQSSCERRVFSVRDEADERL
jgi:hypothetical protein